MPKNEYIAVANLHLDLGNFRTIRQADSGAAIHAMISISPGRFWALMESLIQDGYLPTENIILLKEGRRHIVKEGNRRIGAIKMILGEISVPNLQIPSHLEAAIKSLPKEWKKKNTKVPCAVYEEKEADTVDRIIALTHGKGQLAGRDAWNPVARARQNRDKNGASEPALDLLEKYVREGQNRTPEQAERWAGDYQLSILDEAMKRIAPRLGLASARELADRYPNLPKDRIAVEGMLREVGLELLTFNIIRDSSEDFASARYGIQAASQNSSAPTASVNAGPQATTTVAGQQTSSVNATNASPPPNSVASGRRLKAVSNSDPRSVLRTLKKFAPRGNGREKLVALLEEARTLKLDTHKHSFCFLLRSMFELSAKAYCDDHKSTGCPAATRANGEDRFLVDVLRDVEGHLTKNNSDRAMVRRLHGAMTELANPYGLFSITSLNQLIHNPRFSLAETHICTVFWNVFPLLEEMNR